MSEGKKKKENVASLVPPLQKHTSNYNQEILPIIEKTHPRLTASLTLWWCIMCSNAEKVDRVLKSFPENLC